MSLLVRTLIIAIALFVAGEAARAQSERVHQTGTVTRGHLSLWANPGVVTDAGGSLDGKIQSLGIIPAPLTPLPPFCINDAIISSPSGYHQLCASSNDAFADGGQLTYSAIGPATNDPLTLQSANVLALSSSNQNIVLQDLPQTVTGDVPVCVNPVTGQLFQAAAVDTSIILTDDAGVFLLTDDSGTNLLTAILPAGKCLQQ